MQDSPVLKLQDMASSSSTPIEDLLSRAKMISVKLGLTDISEWLEHEIIGYPNFKSLPKYRIITDVPVKAHNPYVGYIPFNFGNLSKQNRGLYETFTTVHIINPVSMLNEFSKNENILYSDLPASKAIYLQEKTDCDYQLFWAINPAQITRIISNIRSIILDWALLLESKGIYGEGLLFSPEEKKEAQSVTYNNTINNNGSGLTVIGDVKSDKSVVGGTVIDVRQHNITGDFSSLASQLKEHGIDDADIQELKEIVDQSPAPATLGEVGKSFGAWIGKITGKCYTNSVKIAGAAAPAILTNAICQYFGIAV